MKTAIAMLESTNPYSQSRVIDTEKHPKKAKELPDDYERRTWRERMWVTDDGHVFIPPMQFQNSLKEAAKFLSIPVPSKGGKVTFTKNFEAGVMVMQRIVLPDIAEKVESERLYVPADGKRNGTKRVWRYFPYIPHWLGTVTYHILDDIITEDVFRRVLETSGKLIGIGRFRPRNWGYYGTFKVNEMLWNEED